MGGPKVDQKRPAAGIKRRCVCSGLHNSIRQAIRPRPHVVWVPRSRIELRPQDKIELTILRLPRNGTVTIVVVHEDGEIFPTPFKKLCWELLLKQVESSHSHPARPRVTHYYYIAILVPHFGIVLQQIIIGPQRLLPIVTIRKKRN